MNDPWGLKELDGIPVVEIFGEAGLESIDELREALMAAEQSRTPSVVVSLMHAEYFDSSTIHALLTFGERLRRSGRRVVVVGPSGDSGRRILSIFGLASRVQVVDTFPKAIAWVKASASSKPHAAGKP